MTKKISGTELKSKLDRGEDIVVLEALPLKYYRKAHIPGALSFPVDQIDERAARLLPDKDAEIIVYCANGPCENSEIAAERLIELGYRNVADYVEGKEEWIKLGYPVVRGSSPSQEQETEKASCCA